MMEEYTRLLKEWKKLPAGSEERLMVEIKLADIGDWTPIKKTITQDIDVSEYRIEYTEKGIPGILFKYVNGATELMVVLHNLHSEWIDFDNVKIYRN